MKLVCTYSLLRTSFAWANICFINPSVERTREPSWVVGSFLNYSKTKYSIIGSLRCSLYVMHSLAQCSLEQFTKKNFKQKNATL